ncbi:MAG: CinA family nicotinamide mononucleotide deamidase-related protein [Chloroflexi bacterium]|nr:CinA family nicotinamide mononucleotide deamidase-related protein [Chloroflexota bacterium]
MKAEILSVGTELLLGQIVDTNAAYLGQQLAGLGIDLFWISQVGDNRLRVVDALRRAWDRSDAIILTGGLGPTEDDLTREAICDLLGETPRVDDEALARLRAWFARRGVQMSERNAKQCWVTDSARPLPNPIGTAPGWWVERDGRCLAAMPGVPNEMRLMWEQQVAPRLRARAGGWIILSKNLKVIGIGESAVEELLGALVRSTNPTVATYAKSDGVHVRVTAKAQSAGEAGRLIDGMEAQIRPLLGDAIYGADGASLEAATLALLRSAGLTLATIETETGGQLAASLVGAGGADVLRGGLVVPVGAAGGPRAAAGDPAGLSPFLQRLGLHPAEVSPAAAAALAEAARRELGADVGLAVVGCLDPAAPDRAGTYHIALAGQSPIDPISSVRRTTPAEWRRFAAFQAVAALRRWLLVQVSGLQPR